MASSNYAACLALVLREEGGYVNHPKDPGGATMKGVTQAVYDAYRRRNGRSVVPVRQIAPDELQAIYRLQYWNVIRGDDLPAGVDLAVFDFAVNSGPARATKFLQQIVGAKVDGQLGEGTLAKVRGWSADQLVIAICNQRLKWLKTLTTFSTFGRGWTARVGRIKKAGLDMGDGVALSIPAHAPAETGPAKAEVTDQKVTSTTTGKGAVVLGTGTAGQVLTDAADKIAPLGEAGTIFKVLFAVLLIAGVGITIYGILKTARSPEALA